MEMVCHKGYVFLIGDSPSASEGSAIQGRHQGGRNVGDLTAGQPHPGVVEIKGAAILETIARIKEEFGPDAHSRILRELSERSRPLFQATILPNAWYSLESFVEYIGVENRILYKGDRSVILANSEKIVERQLEGVYKLFTKDNTPLYVVGRIGIIHASYFRGVSLEVASSMPGRYVGHYKGFQAAHRMFEFSISAFYRKALEKSGAKNVKAEFTIPMGAPQGFSEITVTWT